ncbi:MAG: hypothetical protein GF344_14160 [Chitinivibrionales bacterium]|nr:hypothetical protein [Chitinivibrionales bacterium]MBD3357871.1 hypothetical protein [Chitinivibrionales bacterium]
MQVLKGLSCCFVMICLGILACESDLPTENLVEETVSFSDSLTVSSSNFYVNDDTLFLVQRTCECLGDSLVRDMALKSFTYRLEDDYLSLAFSSVTIYESFDKNSVEMPDSVIDVDSGFTEGSIGQKVPVYVGFIRKSGGSDLNGIWVFDSVWYESDGLVSAADKEALDARVNEVGARNMVYLEVSQAEFVLYTDGHSAVSFASWFRDAWEANGGARRRVILDSIADTALVLIGQMTQDTVWIEKKDSGTTYRSSNPAYPVHTHYNSIDSCPNYEYPQWLMGEFAEYNRKYIPCFLEQWDQAKSKYRIDTDLLTESRLILIGRVSGEQVTISEDTWGEVVFTSSDFSRSDHTYIVTESVGSDNTEYPSWFVRHFLGKNLK